MGSTLALLILALPVPRVLLQIDGKPAGTSVDEVARKLKGAEGSTVGLRLGRSGIFGKETLTVSLKRGPIQQKPAAGKPAAPQPARAAPAAPPVPTRPQTSPAASPFLPGLFGAEASSPERQKAGGALGTGGGLFAFAGGTAADKKAVAKTLPASRPAEKKSEQGGFDLFGGSWKTLISDVQSAVGGKGSVGVACACVKGSIMINGLQPGGAAMKSGQVRVSDILLEIDGKQCPSTVDGANALLRGPAGSTVALKLKRSGMFGEDIIKATLTRIDPEAEADAKKKEAAAREAKQKEEAANKAKAAAEAKAKAESKAKAEAAAKKVLHACPPAQ